MEKQLIKRALIPSLILALTCSLTFAVPPGYDPGRPDANASLSVHPDSLSGQGIVSASGSGDEVFVLCELDVYQRGTFGGSDCWGWEGPDGSATEARVVSEASGPPGSSA